MFVSQVFWLPPPPSSKYIVRIRKILVKYKVLGIGAAVMAELLKQCTITTTVEYPLVVPCTHVGWLITISYSTSLGWDDIFLASMGT